MLSNTLSTNEVKDRAGSEVEFTRVSISDRKTVFNKVNMNPALPNLLTISHQESGAGLTKRRRSVVRVDLMTTSGVDSVTPVNTAAYLILDNPIGAVVNGNAAADAIAQVLSFCASLGASTTILYDGTGNGATALIQGGL